MTRRALFGLIGAVLFWRKPKTQKVGHQVVQAWTANARKYADEAVCVTEWWARSEKGAEVVYRAAAPGFAPLFWRETVAYWPFSSFINGVPSAPKFDQVEFSQHVTKEELAQRYGDFAVLHPQSIDVISVTMTEDMTKEEFRARYPLQRAT